MMRQSRMIHVALLVLSAFMLAACSEAPDPAPGPDAAAPPPGAMVADWLGFRGDAALHGVALGTLPAAPELVWTFSAGGAIVSSPVVAGDLVYVGSDDGMLYALDVATGEQRWAFATEDLIEAPPFVFGGTVYVGSHDYRFYAVDAVTGEVRWSFETQEKIVGAANFVRDGDGRPLVVFGSHDGGLYALDPVTGEERWAYPADDRINATPAVDGNRVIFGGCDTDLHVVDGATGAGIVRIPLGPEANVAASVAVDDDAVFFGHANNEVMCVDLATETIRWRYTPSRFGFYSAPAVTARFVLIGGRDKRLHCLDRETGEAVWTYATRRKIDAAPVVCGDAVVVAAGDGRLRILGLDDGAERWSYDVGKPLFSSPAVVRGMIIVGSNDGNLYAFGSGAEPKEAQP